MLNGTGMYYIYNDIIWYRGIREVDRTIFFSINHKQLPHQQYFVIVNYIVPFFCRFACNKNEKEVILCMF